MYTGDDFRVLHDRSWVGFEVILEPLLVSHILQRLLDQVWRSQRVDIEVKKQNFCTKESSESVMGLAGVAGGKVKVQTVARDGLDE